jgi:hypothetical protein
MAVSLAQLVWQASFNNTEGIKYQKLILLESEVEGDYLSQYSYIV